MPKIVALRQDWIDLGYKLFAGKGIDGINVEKMADRLNCNKSSFYWHFKNRNAFLDEVINYWHRENPISKMVLERNKYNPKKAFKSFIKKWFQDKSQGDFMFHFRSLARKNDHYKEILNRVIDRQLQRCTQLIQQLGISANKANESAKVLYRYHSGWYEENKHRIIQPADMEQVFREINTFIPLSPR